MASLSAAITSNGLDALTLTQATPAPGAPAGLGYEWLITDGVGASYGQSFDPALLPLTVDALPAGAYTSQVVATDPNSGTTYASRVFSFSLSGPAAACDLTLSGLTVTQPTATSSNGFLSFIASTSRGPVQVQAVAVPGGQYVFGQVVAGDGTVQQLGIGMPAGDYRLEATDQAGCTTSQLFTVTAYAQQPVLGCTDPLADNYDPLATQDNGTCQYTPPPRYAYFEVPAMQSLRFVQPTRLDKPAFDNTLLADETPLDYTIDPYCQKVEQGDRLVIQCLSNYQGAPVLTIRTKDSAAASVLTVPASRVQQGAGRTATFEVYLKPDPIAGFWRAYFNDDALPLPFLPGQRITIGATGTSLDGTYPIHDVLEDAAAAVPYLRVIASYPTGNVRVDGTLTTTYAVQVYDTYQFVVDFGTVAPGCYFAQVDATDTDFPAALAVSEPIDVAVSWPKTKLITYRNFDNAYGLKYSYGLVNRLRITARFFRRQPAGETTVLRNDDKELELLQAAAYRKIELETLLLPDWLHEVLFVAFKHDFVKVDDLRVVLEEAYTFEPVERYSLGRGTALLEARNFLGAGNRDDLGDPATGSTVLVANQKFLKVNR